MASSISARQPVIKHSGEIIRVPVDFTNLLTSGVTLTGTPTVAASPSGLTISGVAVNDSAISLPSPNAGVTIAIGKAVLFTVAGGTSGTDYVVTVTAVTSTGQTRVITGTLQVRDS